MRDCAQSLADFWLKAFGIGPNLPSTDITLCDQLVLIGSGLMLNVYFAVFAVCLGFFFALALAVMKASPLRWLRLPASTFVFVFRGSPLVIQFFFAYSLFTLLPQEGALFAGSQLQLGEVVVNLPGLRILTKAWCGAALVLFFNTSAYTAEVFYGALQAVPRGDIEAARAFGFGPWKRFRRITLPTLLRLAWPGYTNEAIFLFHATTLVFLSAFPTFAQAGEALRFAKYFNAQTFNPFVPFPIIALYFVLATAGIIFVFGRVNLRLNKHNQASARTPIRYRPMLMR